MITSINRPVDPADAITSVVATFKQRDQWSRKTARDPRVKLMHRHVLRSLALCARTDSGGKLVFDPTYDELAKAARCHKRTAQRAVAVAEEIGIVRMARHSDGRVSNAYELLLPQAVSNGDNFRVPTVTNSGADEGLNGDKLSIPTVTNLPGAAGPNGDTAAAVLRLRERKEVSKQESKRTAKPPSGSADDDRLCIATDDSGSTAVDAAPNPAFVTVDGAAISEALTPVPRADARTETVAVQPQPPFATPIGTAAANGADSSGFARIRMEFERLTREYPHHRVGDTALLAFNAAVRQRGVTRVVMEIRTMLERGGDVPDLAEALMTIANE